MEKVRLWHIKSMRYCQYGREKLLKNGIDPREARLLLAYSMGISLNNFMKYTECNEEEYQRFLSLVKRRVSGEPYAYITGHKEFMKLDFKVNEHTLIPREDTEILVQKAIEIINHLKEATGAISVEKKKIKKIRVLDLCTGSGCIAISIAKYIPEAMIEASDISKEALEVASDNAYTNHVKVHLIQSDLFERINQKYDMIVSNPPYIVSSEMEKLQVEVQKEPQVALDGGIDGLEFYRRIAKEASLFLTPKGYVIFEIGYDQGKSVSKILEKEGYENIEVLKDFSGNDRVIVANVAN